MDVFLVYAGLLILLAGIILIVKPLPVLGVRARKLASLVLCAGLLLALCGALLPAPLIRKESMGTHLDYFVPVYQFYESHSVLVRASPERVFQAVKAVTPDEILLFRTLTWLRSPRFSEGGRRTVLDAPPGKPILETATSSDFLLLAEEPGREVVLGTVLGDTPFVSGGNPTPEDFMLLVRPGYSKIAINFHVQETGGDLCRVTTETRIFCTDFSARTRFGVYWRLIYPGSDIIRRMWLRAVKRRAEAG